jgi:ABC-type transporter Mla subunit MlaD
MALDPRNRTTKGLNLVRVRLEGRRAFRSLVIYLVGVLIGLGCFFYIVRHIGGGFGDTQQVRFAVRDATGVVPGRAEVRFKGIPAGTISAVTIKDDRAVITANVARSFGPIYRDAQAALRPNTPLQDMYLDITDRGSASAGRIGSAPLPMPQTATGVNVAQVLQVFQPGVRAHMAALIDQLGVGLTDRGQELRATFVELGPFIAEVGRLADQLAERGRRTRRAVHNVAELTEVLGARDTQLRTLLNDANSVLATTADGHQDLEQTIHELPPTLQELDASLTAVHGILPDVDNALRALRPAADRLPAGLTALTDLSDAAKPAITALQEPLGKLVPLSDELRPTAVRLNRFVGVLRPQLADVAHATRTLAGCPAAAYMFFQHTASLGKFSDQLGVYPRGDFGFGADSVSGAKDPGVVASKSCAPGAPRGAAP